MTCSAASAGTTSSAGATAPPRAVATPSSPELGDDLIDADLGCRDLVDYSVGHATAVSITLGDSPSTQDIDPTAGTENETFHHLDRRHARFAGRGHDQLLRQHLAAQAPGGPGTIVDTIIGGSANDILVGEPGNDPLNGGGGTDVSSYEDRTAAITATVGAGP